MAYDCECELRYVYFYVSFQNRILRMTSTILISKETEDKVKMAKKYIEDRYQNILKQEQEQSKQWRELQMLFQKSPLNKSEKKEIATRISQQQAMNKREWRKKDRLDNYELYSIIGCGAFGEVRLARVRDTNEIVAIKRLKKTKILQKRQIMNTYIQRDILSRNRSQFLIELKSAFQDKEYLYIVMQYAPGGDLLRLLIEKDMFTEQATRFYIAEMILAIEEIHRMGYIHRDIKPDNILIDVKGHVKISDFGLSKAVDNEDETHFLKKIGKVRKHQEILEGRKRNYSKVGTPDYISPQVLTDNQYDQAIDIWSIGVIMFECLFGYPPFSDDNPQTVCQKVIHWLENLEFPQLPQISIQARMLILGMITDRRRRLTIPQIKKHSFFKGLDWAKVRRQSAPYPPIIEHETDTRNFQSYEQKQLWETGASSSNQKTFHENMNSLEHQNLHKRRSSSLQVPSYNFAGFQYSSAQKQNHNLVGEAIREIKTRIRSRKCDSARKIKRLNTDQSEEKIIKNLRPVRSTCVRETIMMKAPKKKMKKVIKTNNPIHITSMKNAK